MRPLVLIGSVLVLALAGCDGDSEPTPGEPEAGEEAGLSEEQREEEERAEAAEHVPEADRVAYYQIATASGIVRIRATATVHGEEIAAAADEGEVRAAIKRIKELAPEDPTLARLRDRLLRTLVGALGVGDTRRARYLIREADAIEEGLGRYAHRVPLIAVFVPD